MSFLVCGEARYDVFAGETMPNGFALDARIGGSALNVALGLARLGRQGGLCADMALVFFSDPLTPMPHDVDVKALLRLAILHDIPCALNRATADLMVHAGVFADGAIP